MYCGENAQLYVKGHPVCLEHSRDIESMPPVRFRAVIEMSFPDADPVDPSDYDNLIERWRRFLEDSPLFRCKDVVIREILTI